MSASSDERELRDAVVARLRILAPDARIIHELNTSGQGSYRVDVAAVSLNRIIAVEIKSKKDKLTRLKHQFEAFSQCSHACIVAAHANHFIDSPMGLVLNDDGFHNYPETDHIWHYPIGDDIKLKFGAQKHQWDLPRSFSYSAALAAVPLLRMLWSAELQDECIRHNTVYAMSGRQIILRSNATIQQRVVAMSHEMTGREIVAAVCRQLRARVFAEADAAIPIVGLEVAA